MVAVLEPYFELLDRAGAYRAERPAFRVVRQIELLTFRLRIYTEYELRLVELVAFVLVNCHDQLAVQVGTDETINGVSVDSFGSVEVAVVCVHNARPDLFPVLVAPARGVLWVFDLDLYTVKLERAFAVVTLVGLCRRWVRVRDVARFAKSCKHAGVFRHRLCCGVRRSRVINQSKFTSES